MIFTSFSVNLGEKIEIAIVIENELQSEKVGRQIDFYPS